MKIIKYLKGVLSDDSGSVTIVEAVYIFPIVFFVIGFLILTSFYQLQKSSLLSDAQRIALTISRSKINPVFNQFDGNISNQIDFKSTPQTYPQDKPSSNYSPYRYLTSKIENIEMINKKLNELIHQNALLAGPKIDSEVKCVNGFPNQLIVVSFRSQIESPGFMVYLGLPKISLMHVTGTARIMDSTEYVRNVDLASDAIIFLKEKTKIGEDFRKYVSEIAKVIPK
ncbi:MAG: hypothetical protein K0R71_1890 [Bacillales bacterium]|jgi:hypothetical protein|nr:hypothetical protein [Bacillales bacterium]